ncbi:MAG: family 43 glycosylhydrolase [Bacteroidales bacterium]|nr:family 43 glycosylhydrolase [Bacteroidales bacterium]
MAVKSQSTHMTTYCNPVNLDYTYMIYNAHNDISYRSGADPAVVEFRGEYYMFVTRSMGYWHSDDLQNWNFIAPEKWYFEGSNAPAAFNYKDSLLYVIGNPSGNGSILYTDNPRKGDWKAVPGILYDLQDPALFIDDDNKAYMYWGSSNVYPIRVVELDKYHRFKPVSGTIELFNLNGDKHGWERFGENHSDTILGGYMEGPWMTKHDGKYYLQYAAPGTEFNVYGDGVYIGESPLGPFFYAPNNPFCYKPGGFMNGAGHGSTVAGPGNRYWHFASMAVSINVNWERRIDMFPTFFDKDGLMWSNTSFGDYPHYAPAETGRMGEFAGWMLLSYKKPVKASSELNGFPAQNTTDENVKTFWVAANNNESQWLEIDLQNPGTVYAVQVNYHDYKSDLYGRMQGLFHRYYIEGSNDGKKWEILVDRKNSFKDVPNDYVELEQPAKVRYIRYINIHVPTPNLSISDLRIFGKGEGKAPQKVSEFKAERKSDRRDALLTWEKQQNAQGYNVHWGIAPDKLYNTWLVYDKNELELKCLDKDQSYYFAIEAFNENGRSALTQPLPVK